MKNQEKQLYTEKPGIFAVSYKEIAKRQFFAGFMSGLGAATATILVGFVLTVIIAGFVVPRFHLFLTSFKTTLESAGFSVSSPTQ